MTDTSCIEMMRGVKDRYTDRRKLVTLTLAAKSVDFDRYVADRRREGDSWVALSARLHDEFEVDIPQGTLHRWFRESESVAA